MNENGTVEDSFVSYCSQYSEFSEMISDNSDEDSSDGFYLNDEEQGLYYFFYLVINLFFDVSQVKYL